MPALLPGQEGLDADTQAVGHLLRSQDGSLVDRLATKAVLQAQEEIYGGHVITPGRLISPIGSKPSFEGLQACPETRSHTLQVEARIHALLILPLHEQPCFQNLPPRVTALASAEGTDPEASGLTPHSEKRLWISRTTSPAPTSDSSAGF